MLKSKIILHNAQIEKAKEKFKLNPEVLFVIENMQEIIDELIRDNQELEQILREDGINYIGRI